jgi:hypothetical protein
MLRDMMRELDEKFPPEPVLMPVEPTPIYRPRRVHRKKRIAKKWLKRFGKKLIGFDRFLGDDVVRLPSQVGFPQGVMVAHPDIVRLVRAFESRYRDQFDQVPAFPKLYR